jgi:hypothetical protein
MHIHTWLLLLLLLPLSLSLCVCVCAYPSSTSTHQEIKEPPYVLWMCLEGAGEEGAWVCL